MLYGTPEKNAVFSHSYGRPGLILSVGFLEIRTILCLVLDLLPWLKH
jgi:hypothetical protein